MASLDGARELKFFENQNAEIWDHSSLKEGESDILKVCGAMMRPHIFGDNGQPLPNGQDNFVPASQLSLVTYRGGAGTETLWERASDGIQYGAWVSLNATGTESAPVVAPTSASVVASYKSSVAATTLFTVYDQDGDAITQYDFWDNGMGGGHWSINGVAQGSSVEIIVNASQLSQVTYTPGAGTDTLFVRANDGLLWSAWTMGFSATDTAPVSTPVHNLVGGAGTGKTYAVSDLFAVSDADGDAPTQYDFWDNGAGGGHWFIGNATQGSNQEILVNASQLSQVTYHAGTGQAPTRSTCAPRTACISVPGRRGWRSSMRRLPTRTRAHSSSATPRALPLQPCSRQPTPITMRSPSTISGTTAWAAATGRSTVHRREATWRLW